MCFMLIIDDEEEDNVSSNGDDDGNHANNILSFAGAASGRRFSGFSCEFLQDKPLCLYRKGHGQGKGRGRRVEKDLFILV